MSLPAHVQTLADLAVEFDMRSAQALKQDAKNACAGLTASSGGLAYAVCASMLRELSIMLAEKEP